MGILITVLGVALTYKMVSGFLEREPLPLHLPTPTILRLTAPPSEPLQTTSQAPTATTIPTFTPLSTPDLSIAPQSITVGYYAQVINTDSIGVSLRGGPSTDNIRIQLLPEGTVMLVVGGPEVGGDFTWWQVQLETAEKGWIAGEFLTPSSSPN